MRFSEVACYVCGKQVPACAARCHVITPVIHHQLVASATVNQDIS